MYLSPFANSHWTILYTRLRQFIKPQLVYAAGGGKPTGDFCIYNCKSPCPYTYMHLLKQQYLEEPQFIYVSAGGDRVSLSCVFFTLVQMFIRKLVLGFSQHWKVYSSEEHLYQAITIKRVMLIICLWRLVIIISVVITRFHQPMDETDYPHHLLSHPPASWGLLCHLGTQIMDQIPLTQSTALKPQCQASVKSSIIMRLPKVPGHRSIKW